MNINNNLGHEQKVQRINSAEDILSYVDEGANPEELFMITQEIVQEVLPRANFWTVIVNFFYRLVGKVSDYEFLQHKIVKLEEQLGETLDRIAKAEQGKVILSSSTHQLNLQEAQGLTHQLDIAKSQLEDVTKGIKDETEAILIQFDEVDELLNGLERQINKKPEMNQQFIDLVNQSARAAQSLNAIGSIVDRASEIYIESTADLTPIKSLVDRYEAAAIKLKRIQERLTSYWITEDDAVEKTGKADSKIESVPSSILIGGIRNGGNTCYVASAMQTVHAIPAYQRAMDPKKNPLQRREGEAEVDFAKRTLIQRLGHAIVQKITQGEEVSRNEINRFREACYADRSNGGKRVVDSLRDTADAAETLERILNVLDFRFGNYQVTQRRTLLSEKNKISTGRNPAEFTTLNAMAAGKVEVREPTIEVAAYGYLDQEVSMQRLVDETWAPEDLSNVKVASLDDKGLPCVRKYQRMRLQKEVTAKEPPEVIRITVKQLEENKATLTHADTLFPMGTGNGPMYKLKAVIEHRPGHYVAHIRGEDGMYVEANDSWVHAGKKNLPGFAYYYVRADIAE